MASENERLWEKHHEYWQKRCTYESGGYLAEAQILFKVMFFVYDS